MNVDSPLTLLEPSVLGREQKEWLLEKLGAKELRVGAYSSLSFKPEDVIY